MAKLKDVDHQTVRSWIKAGRTVAWIASVLECSHEEIKSVSTTGNFGYVPSPDEVKRGTLRAQKNWDARERETRRVSVPQPMTIQTVRVSDIAW